jgi:hypothetical protein
MFATRVRDIMAQHLGVPTTEHSFDDVLLQMFAKKLGEPMDKSVIQLHTLQKFLNLNVDAAKDYLKRFAALDTDKTGRITLEQVIAILPALPQLCLIVVEVQMEVFFTFFFLFSLIQSLISLSLSVSLCLSLYI